MRLLILTLFCVGALFGCAPAPAPPDSAPAPAPTGDPATRRLAELIAAVESGSSERIRAYIREAYAPEVLRRNNLDRVVQYYMAMHDRSRGLEVDSLRSTYLEAAALLRSKQTGLWEQLSVRVEPTPPHRLLDFASFRIEPPKHPLSKPGASDAARVREIERVARNLSEADVFSGVVLLARGDSILYQGAFGQADKERGITIQPDTRFGLASLTKPFVSVAVAKLVEQGKLSWEDPLGKFLPDFPLEGAREGVRIKHLLTHTSGLQDFTRYCERNPCREQFRSMNDYVRMAALAQEDSLLYEPGTRSFYNNANFILLAKIIEREAGQPFYEYIRENVLRPAGMEDTDLSEPGRMPKRLAVAYDKQYTEDSVRWVGEAPRPEAYVSYPAPFAGAHSTARDLFRFAEALRSGRILRPETVRVLFSPKPEAGDWSYGFDVLDEERGLVGHGGSWIGMSNSLDMLPESGYTSVILSNYTNARSPLREAIWAILP
jgi:CubicO group peptidase (beta-lactamase class C family)